MALDSFLVLSGAEPLAALLAPIIAASPFVVANFCSTDPPALPTITQQDVLDLINFNNPVTFPAAQAKFYDWFAAQYWDMICG